MISYNSQVHREAMSFMLDNEELIVDGLKDEEDWDRNDIPGLDTRFHEEIVDRAYTLQDAAFVLENSSNEETDMGLVEGQSPSEALGVLAAFSFGNDVWFECEEIYNEMRDAVEAIVGVCDWGADGIDSEENEGGKLTVFKVDDSAIYFVQKGDDEIAEIHVSVPGHEEVIRREDEVDLYDGEFSDKIDGLVKAVADKIVDEEGFISDTDLETAIREYAIEVSLQEFRKQEALPYIEPGSEQEKSLLEKWLRLGSNVERGAYPLGGAYIDSRCGTGFGMPDELEYVEFDNQIGGQLPHLRGKGRQDVRAYFEETFQSSKGKDASAILGEVLSAIEDDDMKRLRGMQDDIREIVGGTHSPRM